MEIGIPSTRWPQSAARLAEQPPTFRLRCRPRLFPLRSSGDGRTKRQLWRPWARSHRPRRFQHRARRSDSRPGSTGPETCMSNPITMATAPKISTGRGPEPISHSSRDHSPSPKYNNVVMANTRAMAPPGRRRTRRPLAEKTTRNCRPHQTRVNVDRNVAAAHHHPAGTRINRRLGLCCECRFGCRSGQATQSGTTSRPMSSTGAELVIDPDDTRSTPVSA